MFGSLSLTARFLIAPLLGIVFTLVIYLSSYQIIQSNSVLFKSLSETNLVQISEINKISIQLANSNSEIFTLLLESASFDEEEIYIQGKRQLNLLYDIEQSLIQSINEKNTLIIDGHVIFEEIRAAFSLYQNAAITAIELSSVEPESAISALKLANHKLKILNRSFYILSEYYAAQLTSQAQQVEGSLYQKTYLTELAIALMLLMLWSAFYFSRTTSKSLTQVCDALILLAQGDTNIKISCNNDHYIKDIWSAVGGFKKSIETNEAYKIELLNQKYAMDQHAIIATTDLKGMITYANSKFCHISGYTQEELTGKNHRILNSGNQDKAYWKEMYKVVSNGQVWNDEIRNKRKNGDLYWVDSTIIPMVSSANKYKITGYISIRTDITQKKRQHAQLLAAVDLANSAVVAKSQFLANMSHEIRTPMNGVIGMTNLLLDTQLTPEQVKLASTVKSSASGLLGIINDVLDYSKVAAGKLDLELIPFNLGQIVEDVGTNMSYQADLKKLPFICPANPIVQQWVKTDPGRIRQILTNLIGNAIKFTDAGEVAVFVKLLEENSTHKTFRFEVSDTGIGISKEQYDQLFEKFTQADATTTRKYGGTGLGLSICKHLVELMGGDIGVISEQGKGSTFWINLPLLKSDPLVDTPVYSSDISQEKILIVDDNQTNRNLMEQLHSLWEIPHTLVGNAQAALAELTLAAAENQPYSIAILDMHMPNINGLALGEQIKSQPLLSETKLIMVSSRAQQGDPITLQTAGFMGYLSKPIHQSELLDVLLTVSGLKTADPQFVTGHSTKQQAKFKAHILVVEDNATNQLVIEGLLRSLGITVDLAGNGAEAITTLQSITSHDLVFMDCQMPVLDGYAATKKIRSDTSGIANTNIPIIAMTANAMTGDKQACLDVGMDDYLSKPIAIDKVISMLQKWLPEHSILNQEAPQEQKKDIQKQQIIIFDYEDLSNRLMADKELINAVAEVFFEDFIEKAASLKEYVNEQNITQCSQILHQINGACANVGGKRLQALASTMEQAAKSNNIDAIALNITSLEEEFTALKNEMEKVLI